MRNDVPGGDDDEVTRLIDAALLVMRDSGSLDPQVRDIVRTAGLSNQSFYRHFESKDALLLAVIERGQMQLLETIEERMGAASTPDEQVRAWVETILVQARQSDAMRNTRPFITNGARLADLFPEMSMRSMKALAAPLGAAIAAMGGTAMDTRLVYDLSMSTMHHFLLFGRKLPRADMEYAITFVLDALAASAARQRAMPRSA